MICDFGKMLAPASLHRDDRFRLLGRSIGRTLDVRRAEWAWFRSPSPAAYLAAQRPPTTVVTSTTVAVINMTTTLLNSVGVGGMHQRAVRCRFFGQIQRVPVVRTDPWQRAKWPCRRHRERCSLSIQIAHRKFGSGPNSSSSWDSEEPRTCGIRKTFRRSQFEVLRRFGSAPGSATHQLQAGSANAFDLADEDRRSDRRARGSPRCRFAAGWGLGGDVALEAEDSPRSADDTQPRRQPSAQAANVRSSASPRRRSPRRIQLRTVRLSSCSSRRIRA